MQPDQHGWNYSDDGAHGPREWARYFETGGAQSPINILVDYCLVHQHGPTASLREQFGQCKLAPQAPVTGARRGHLDSVGDDDDSNQDDEPAGDERQAARSPSASSNMSSSNESNTSSSHGRQPHSKLEERRRQQLCRKPNQQLCRKPRQQQQVQTTRYCGTNKKLFLGYPRYLNTVQLSNTGHGWQIDMPAELACHTLLSGPPFGDREYRLAQFHCHWGADCEHGSEHQLNGRSFSAEIHFVHWNCGQYGSVQEASRHKHGLAVLGVFVQALDGEQNRNKHLDKIIAGLAEVREQPHTAANLRDVRLDLKKLFPANRWNYATYEGSLTTPPLSECVDWLVFLQPITCSSSQIDEFRQLKCPSGALTKNCRPVQPLNGRTVTIWSHANS